VTEKKSKKMASSTHFKKWVAFGKALRIAKRLNQIDMKKIENGALMLIVIMTFTSCSQRLIDFTVISSKSHGMRFDKSKGIRVTGKSYGFLGIGANIKDAMDEALQSAGPQFDLLINGVVKTDRYPFVLGYIVEGTATRSDDLIAALGQKGYEDWCKGNCIFDPETVAVQN